MFNLRFKCTVISSWHMVLHAVPKANKMIANKARPGITIADLQEAAVDYLATECLAAGFIENKED